MAQNKEFDNYTWQPLSWDVECTPGQITIPSSPVQQLDTIGIKHDDGKPRWDLLPMDALEEVVKVYTFGAKKYAPWNWRNGLNYSRVYAALHRHLKAWWWDGKDVDAETQCQHLASVAWCCLSLLHYNINKNKYNNKYNDRPGIQPTEDLGNLVVKSVKSRDDDQKEMYGNKSV